MRNWLLLLQHSAAIGGAAVVRAPVWGLIGLRVLRSGRCRGELLVKVVLQVAEGIHCLLVHALVQFLPHLLVFAWIVRCHLHVFRLTWLSLCLKCIASGFGEDAVRLDRRHLLVGQLVRVSGRGALSSEACPSTLLPSCASLGAEGEE